MGGGQWCIGIAQIGSNLCDIRTFQKIKPIPESIDIKQLIVF